MFSALFRWLVEQRYILANPFAEVRVRGAVKSGLDVTRGFTEGEWLLIRAIADDHEWSYGWTAPAAQRLRFLLDFGYATGLRASEFVGRSATFAPMVVWESLNRAPPMAVAPEAQYAWHSTRRFV